MWSVELCLLKLKGCAAGRLHNASKVAKRSTFMRPHERSQLSALRRGRGAGVPRARDLVHAWAARRDPTEPYGRRRRRGCPWASRIPSASGVRRARAVRARAQRAPAQAAAIRETAAAERHPARCALVEAPFEDLKLPHHGTIAGHVNVQRSTLRCLYCIRLVSGACSCGCPGKHKLIANCQPLRAAARSILCVVCCFTHTGPPDIWDTWLPPASLVT